ncbi:hypothetical protein LNN31_03005 [Acetobacterium wieringae]|uniref:Phage protein n=1 Tax=Acetobacterium wieringae TaxID=52694 RepID=A0ABY6HFW4_9FIRM|nr:hypothetical protein [Acetobacterium wieringae]UYO63428.1 hypothetical protein LNN31_03005 [Acetobacterium wieringae]VUZ23927.1 Uncharacterised protein [Acetobacterium wieringae]
MNQQEHIQKIRKQAQADARNNNINETLWEFEFLHGKLNDMLCGSSVDVNYDKLDRLTAELLKVVELKKIASILAEKE